MRPEAFFVYFKRILYSLPQKNGGEAEAPPPEHISVLQLDFLAARGGIIHCLHHLCGNDNRVDVGRELFSGLDAANEGVDFVLEVVCMRELGLAVNKATACGGIYGEVAAVIESCACLGADEVNVRFGNTDVLRPCAVEGDGGAFGTYKSGNKVVNVV